MNTNQKYEAAFKRRGSGRLQWAHGHFPNEAIATHRLQELYSDKKFKLYGGPFLCQS